MPLPPNCQQCLALAGAAPLALARTTLTIALTIPLPIALRRLRPGMGVGMRFCGARLAVRAASAGSRAWAARGVVKRLGIAADGA